jgi:hypothetical protein
MKAVVRMQVCNAVALARHLNLNLIIPDFVPQNGNYEERYRPEIQLPFLAILLISSVRNVDHGGNGLPIVINRCVRSKLVLLPKLVCEYP